ncbi:putative solid-state culture-specific atp-grasp domain protein [Cladorrhinum samala]|uniref:Solid-state culture-specific atp-grasp domain protein n=1 Tax=Cladorrhinum samala TaxID=585594 RepID=A0AAV9HGY0_9PEZI|nr:putative solid-state culture-specific atp-grasp domain protein [Cladorrhinum samala]
MVFCGTNSGLEISSDFPRNVNYPYQDGIFIGEPKQKLNSKNRKLQKTLAAKYLSLLTQRDSFIAGTSPVIMFTKNRSPKQVSHDLREAETTLSVLEPSQRPELVFCPGPAQIPMSQHKIDQLTYKVSLDSLSSYPLTHDLDTHWILNSKAGLARSGLPTPRSDIFDIASSPPPPSACCASCESSASSGQSSMPESCTGPRLAWLKGESAKILSVVSSRPVPFVFKNQQTWGGAGTWVVSTAEDKQALIDDLSGRDGVLWKVLSQVTEENAHLCPAAVLLSDMVSNAVADYGITFVVGPSSETPIFLGVSEQMIDQDSHAWVGSTINYSKQEELKAKFRELVERTAKYVAAKGYTGPVGIDVLETAEVGATESNNGERTKYHIVDMNVRTSGSLALPLMRGHFFEQGGLNCASSFSVEFKGKMGGREGFVKRWKDEFERGEMVILSWYDDLDGETSVADVVVGAKEDKDLQVLMERVREEAEEVTF